MRTGYTAATSRSLSSSASEVGSSRVEMPFSTRTYRYSAAIRAPLDAIRARNCSCNVIAAPVHARISPSEAFPPLAATLVASEGARRTTT